MQSAEIDNLVPITREVLREYYKQFPVIEPSEELKELSVKLKKLCEDGGLILKADGEGDPELKEIQDKFLAVPRKLDENMWRVRQQLEDILYLQEPDNLKPVEDVVKGLDSIKLDDWQSALKEIKQGCQEAFESIEGFQKGGMKKIQTLISTFLPNDFRISIVKAQQERSEANREAQIKALIESGGTIKEKYDLYWELQLQRRQTLVNIGNATGAFKMILKYIGGVPQVLLDFIKTVNDNEGPMDELRQTYGPQMYFYAELINVICMYLWLVFATLQSEKQTERRKAIAEGLGENMKVVQSAISLFKVEIIRYLEQQLKILEGSPFFVSKNEAGGDDSTTEFKEMVVAKEFVARVKARPQDTVVVAFNTVGKDIGFAVTFESKSGENKKTVREYERVNSHAKEVADQFVGEEDGFFLFRWDNSYSWLSSKTLNYKVYNKTLVDAAASASSSSQDGGEEDAAAFEDLVKAADGEKDK